jgi:alkylhydroperoxidase family enzyme
VSNRYRDHIERVFRAVLGTPGATDESLRRAVESRAAALGGRSTLASDATLPPALASYIDKVGRHAYKVTDADIDALKAAGFSEDAIFELTVSAALGAAAGRLERGLAVLGASRRET